MIRTGPLAKNVILLSFLMVVLLSSAYPQRTEPKISLQEAFKFWEKKRAVKFFYKNEWIADGLVSASMKEQSFQFFLETVLAEVGISYIPMFDFNYIVLFKGSPPAFSFINDSTINFSADHMRIDTYSLSGYVRDATTEEIIEGATVFSEPEGLFTITNSKGYFNLSLPMGIHTIRITAIGKTPLLQKISLENNINVSYELYEQTTQLDDVVIVSGALNKNVSSIEMSQIKIDINTMKSIPPFMGEVDVIKSILLLPGVSTVGEGASGFNVRGGNVDQNLILLDDAPLFNSSHLFGFFSTFNPDLVKEVTLHKGGIPAQYGGRLSSVLNVKMRDGATKFSGSGGLGIISSRLLLEGPIGKKTTFIMGGRYAYPNWILRKVPDLNISKSKSYFYDVNFKLQHQLNKSNSIHLSAYRSLDEFKFAADTAYGLTTTNISTKWNTLISQKLVGSITGLVSQYQNQVSGLYPTKEFDLNFGTNTHEIKGDFTYFLNTNNKVDFGANITYFIFNPGALTRTNNSSISEKIFPKEYALERSAYVSHEVKIKESIIVQAGLRYARYSALGAGDVFLFDETLPKSSFTIIDTLRFSKGESIKTYQGWEPRLSAKFSLSASSSIKASYNRNYQYLQLISNTTAVSPLDIWKTSNYTIKPQIGDQWALGYFKNLSDNLFEFSAEAYYKKMKNLAEYKDGANLFLNNVLEADLLNARGVAYGIEILTRKNRGNFTGWISYTYSRSLRQVKGNTPEETINTGEWYPSNFDKPHDVTFVGNYKFSRRLSASLNFTYSTGRPITLPQSVYIIDGYSFAQFSERNQGRIPDYHRLDVSLTLEESLKRTKKWKGSWTFSIYNLYGRRNPYSVFFKPQYRGNQTQSYQLAVIGTLFPSISYNFKFG